MQYLRPKILVPCSPFTEEGIKFASFELQAGLAQHTNLVEMHLLDDVLFTSQLN